MYILKSCVGRSLLDSVCLGEKSMPADSCLCAHSLFTFAEIVTNDVDIWNQFSVKFLGRFASSTRCQELFHLPWPKIIVMLMPFSDLGKLQIVVLFIQKQVSHRIKINFLIWELIFSWMHLHAYLCSSKWYCSLSWCFCWHSLIVVTWIEFSVF